MSWVPFYLANWWCVPSAGPACVNKPSCGSMLLHLLSQHSRIFGGVKHYESRPKACWECCLWLLHTFFCPSNLIYPEPRMGVIELWLFTNMQNMWARTHTEHVTTRRLIIKVLSFMKLIIIEAEESVKHGMWNSAPVLKTIQETMFFTMHIKHLTKGLDISYWPLLGLIWYFKRLWLS